MNIFPNALTIVAMYHGSTFTNVCKSLLPCLLYLAIAHRHESTPGNGHCLSYNLINLFV
jgi:hypothetical protein